MKRISRGWLFVVIQLVLLGALEWADRSGFSLTAHVMLSVMTALCCGSLMSLRKNGLACVMAVCWGLGMAYRVLHDRMPLDWLKAGAGLPVFGMAMVVPILFWITWVASLVFAVRHGPGLQTPER